jgi:predicted GNAT family acetyltransferase
LDAITISRHDAGASGEYHAHVAGSEAVGRLTWVTRGGPQDVVRVAEHTLVPTEIGGMGVAAELVKAMIDDARAQHFRIVPACSYVALAFERHPEWSDLLA